MEPDIGAICRSHLAFMKWADETMLAALSPLPEDKVTLDLGNSFHSMLGTLSHVYLAEWLWLKRVQGEQNTQMADLESPPGTEVLGQVWRGLHQMWLDWAGSLHPDDWPNLSTYRNSKGDEFSTPYWQIVLHLVNHGSYHRGQVATMLRQSGITPPGTDLVAFYRKR